MQMTKHAKIRMMQRNIPEEEVDLILERGTPFSARGGALRYLIPKREIRDLIEIKKREIRRLEKAGGKAVVISEDGAIKTVEHVYKDSRVNWRQ